jgi:aromatic-L-amino-acid decarboxylase
MAFFPAGVTYPSMLGEMYCTAFNAPAFNWLCSPACTELETIVLDWMAKAMGLPAEFLSTSPNGGGGVIQGSASEAVVTCMVAARERYLRNKCDAEGLPEGSQARDDRISYLRGRLVALSSDQAHSSTQKGAAIAGTRYKAIPAYYSDDLALTGENLQKALDQCHAADLHPYYLTTSMGTTSTCAVDDLVSIAPIKKKYPELWIHVDAAYAGAALICPEYQHYSANFGLADSFDMNMHKWLLVNFDASCLYVQNRNDLTRALSVTPSYLQNKHTDSGLVTDYRDWQIPLGRRFRSLKIWFVMRTYGLEGMREHIRRTTKLGDVFAGLVRSKSDIYEIVAPPRFALTCFRVKPSAVARNGALNAEDEAASNAITKQIADLINERGEIFITSSTAAGKHMIRVVSANPNAEEKYVRNAFEIIVKTTDEVVGQFRAG